MRYVVTLSRTVVEEVVVEVDAASPADAGDAAVELYLAGDEPHLAWRQVGLVGDCEASSVSTLRAYTVTLPLAGGKSITLQVEALSVARAVDAVVERLGAVGAVDGRDYDSSVAEVVEIALQGGAS